MRSRYVPMSIDNPLAKVESDEELLDFAARIAKDVAEKEGGPCVAESSRRLTVACLALLRDWFGDEDYTPYGMITLFAMALMPGKYDTETNFQTRKTPLDFMFLQIASGMKYVRDESGRWAWRASAFVRKDDKARPARTGGMPQGSDIALSFYDAWCRSAEPRVLEESVRECIFWMAEFGSAGIKQGGIV